MIKLYCLVRPYPMHLKQFFVRQWVFLFDSFLNLLYVPRSDKLVHLVDHDFSQAFYMFQLTCTSYLFTVVPDTSYGSKIGKTFSIACRLIVLLHFSQHLNDFVVCRERVATNCELCLFEIVAFCTTLYILSLATFFLRLLFSVKRTFLIHGFEYLLYLFVTRYSFSLVW